MIRIPSHDRVVSVQETLNPKEYVYCNSQMYTSLKIEIINKNGRRIKGQL